MKKKNSENLNENNDEMLPEYDFDSMTGGVWGKYYKAYRERHTVKIHQADGNIITHYFTVEEGAVMLEPDIQKYFPDSKSVNKALRCLIPLVAPKE